MQKHMSVPYIERRYDHRGITFENMTVMQKILNDTLKCNQYAIINNDIKDISELEIGREIVAFLKNYCRDIIFCSLNLGFSGIIKDPRSISVLAE